MVAGKSKDGGTLGPGVRRRQLSSSGALSDMPNESTENLSQGQRDPTLQQRHGPMVPQAQPPGAHRSSAFCLIVAVSQLRSQILPTHWCSCSFCIQTADAWTSLPVACRQDLCQVAALSLLITSTELLHAVTFFCMLCIQLVFEALAP